VRRSWLASQSNISVTFAGVYPKGSFIGRADVDRLPATLTKLIVEDGHNTLLKMRQTGPWLGTRIYGVLRHEATEARELDGLNGLASAPHSDDAVALGIPPRDDVPVSIRERAWSSPIWCAPGQ